MQAAKRPGAHVYRLILLVTILKPLSNLFLAWGMRGLPAMLATHPASILRALFDPLVMIGIAMQIVWLLMRMSLLSVADLSFVLPVTAAGYVISTLLGREVLHEEVSAARWVGAVLISAGTALVASTPRETTDVVGPVL
jgi:drug/metabolite transporter (DMT)-like permease